MAEKGYFFNSIEGDPREYQAEDFANYFNKFIPTGVFQNAQGLAVTADGSSMNVTVGTGAAFIDGYMYENTEPKILTHDIADPNYDRIDLVVIRLDRNYGVRNIKATIIQGTPGPNPQAPQLIDDGYIKDIPLAEVRIRAGQSTIGQSQITDKRGNLIDTFGKVIEEYGTNANGSYLKFSNGFQIAFKKIGFQGNNLISFRYDNGPIPIEFPNGGVVIVTASTTYALDSSYKSTARTMGRLSNFGTTLIAGAYFTDSDLIPSTESVYLDVIIMGWWK